MSNVWCILRARAGGLLRDAASPTCSSSSSCCWRACSPSTSAASRHGQADLQPFFAFHPWLYLFLVPAISMRLWAEERKQGTIELLLTLPVSMGEAVLGKFLAAWAFTGIALLLTFPIWITVN